MKIKSIYLLIFFSFIFFAGKGSADEIQDSVKKEIDSVIEKIRTEREDLIGSLDLFDRALELAKTHNYKEAEFKLYFYSGKIYRQIGHYEKAIENYDYSKTVAMYLERMDWFAQVLNNESIVYYFQGDLKTSIEVLKRTLPLYKKHSNKPDEGLVYSNLAYIYFENEQYDSAITYNKMAEEVYKSANIENEMVIGLNINFIKMYNKAGYFEKSIAVSKKLLNEKIVQSDVGNLIELHSWWARSLASLGRYKEAEIKFSKAESYLSQSNDHSIRANLYEAKAEMFASVGNNHSALDYLKKAVSLRDSINVQNNNRLLSQFKERLEIEKNVATQKSIEVLKQKNQSNYLSIILFLFLGTIVVSFIMISIKKNAEKLEVEKNTELEIVNKKFESFLEQTNEAIRLSDPEGKVIVWNEASVELTGISKEEAIGNNYFDLASKIIPGELKENYIKWAKKKITEIKITGISKPGSKVIPIFNKDNEKIFIENRIFPIFIDDELYMAGSSIDVTKQIEYEQGLIDSKISAEKSDRSKTEFLAQMSHEIRTPINTILNFCGLIEMECSYSEKEIRKNIFSDIYKSGDRIIKVMDMLLSISEADTGIVDLKPEKMNLKEKVIDPLLNNYSKVAKEKNIDFNLKSNHSEFMVFVDEFTISQAMANLLDSSFRYSNGSKITVQLETGKTGIAKLIMTDNGYLVDEEMIKEVFNITDQSRTVDELNYKNLELILVKKYCDLNNVMFAINNESAVTKFELSFNE